MSSLAMVTHHINGISQEEWRTQVTKQLEEVTKRPVLFRNKPRPGNQWWDTNIKDDLKNACVL